MVEEKHARAYAAHLADYEYTAMLAANSAEPYVHAEYERHEHLLMAALMIFAYGDEPYAIALREAFTDSGENMHWFTTQWTRDELVEQFHTEGDRLQIRVEHARPRT